MNIYFCAREGLACGTHNRNKPILTLSCRGYVKSPKHDHRSCAISIFLFKSILFAGEIEYLDNLNPSKCDRHDHFSSFFHLITGGLVRGVHLSSISSWVVSSEMSPFAYLVWFLSFHPTLASCRVLQLRRALFSHYTNVHYCSDLLKLVQYCPSLNFPIFPSACQDFSSQHHTPVEILLTRSPFTIHGIGLCVLFIHFLYDKLLIISRCCVPNLRVCGGYQHFIVVAKSLPWP